MNRTLLFRVPLLIAYIIASVYVVVLFIRSDGQGSHAPLAILFAWGVLPAEYGLVSKMIGFWVVQNLYLLFLFGVTTIGARSERLVIALSPFVIHGLGVLVALAKVTQHADHAADVTRGFLVASYIAGAVLITAYLVWDWLLARKPNKRAAPNGGPATPLGNSGVAEGPPSVS